jgi:cyclic pyranopterin phosphate synthase
MLADSFGRNFHYLRLSLTDVCNMRCAYCLPNGYEKPDARPDELSRAEIGRLVRAFAAAGFWKVRLSGGEPTVRPDVLDIVREVAACPGVRRVALSTNGYRLRELASELRAAGLTHANVSIDSLDRDRFQRITGRDWLPQVLAGVDAAIAAGLLVKVNAVLLEDELAPFSAWVRERPVVVRFIELMQTGDNGVVFLRRHKAPDALREKLARDGWARRPREIGDGPAEEYRRDGYAGGIGIIAAYAPGFCDTCNRLRVSSTGKLRLCLFGDGEHDLRPLLQHDEQADALGALVRSKLFGKTAGHRLHAGDPGTTRHLASIGG